MYTILDLFAGAGGFSIGFSLVGLSPAIHVEIDKYASETLHYNFPHSKIITEDIRFLDIDTINQYGKIDVIIGGPPCQGFSIAGSTQFGIQDDRNELIFWYLHFVQKLAPKIAVIENVPNVLTKQSKNGESFLDMIKKIATEMGYATEYSILNSVNYGVPQIRNRAFIVLHNPDISFYYPNITHTYDNKMSLLNLKKAVSTGEALLDLPYIEAGENGSGLPYRTEPTNEFQSYCRQIKKDITNHESMAHTERVIARFKIIKQGQSLKDVPLQYGQVSYKSGEISENPFKYNNYRLNEQKPSLTIPASYQSLFVHPICNRNLTAREGARLMSFPDWYHFCGPKTMMSWESGLSQYNQIGNSVCPLVSRAIAFSVKDYLHRFSDKSFVIKTSQTLLNIMTQVKKNNFNLDISNKGKNNFRIYKLNKYEQMIINNYINKNTNTIKIDGISVDLNYILYTLSLLEQKNCTICNASDAPFGNHYNSINLLISKSNLQSLIDKKHDNGLDFHLRVLSGKDERVANEVSFILEKLGFVKMHKLRNQRTGRMVTSITRIRIH